MKTCIFKNRESNIIKNLLLCAILFFPLNFLSGCHTMEGAGTDIQHAGKALERSADNHKSHYHPCSCCCH